MNRDFVVRQPPDRELLDRFCDRKVESVGSQIHRIGDSIFQYFAGWPAPDRGWPEVG